MNFFFKFGICLKLRFFQPNIWSNINFEYLYKIIFFIVFLIVCIDSLICRMIFLSISFRFLVTEMIFPLTKGKSKSKKKNRLLMIYDNWKCVLEMNGWFLLLDLTFFIKSYLYHTLKANVFFYIKRNWFVRKISVSYNYCLLGYLSTKSLLITVGIIWSLQA